MDWFFRVLAVACLYLPTFHCFGFERQRCSEALLAQDFMGPLKYARKLHSRLQEATAADFSSLDWPFRSDRDLARIERRFSFKNETGQPVRLKIEMLRDPEQSAPHVVVLCTFFVEQSPVGFTARLVKVNRQNDLQAKGEGFYLDPNVPEAKGISEYAREFLDREIYRPAKVRRERFLADYTGRYVWAKQGYEFDDAMYYYDGAWRQGPTVKPLEMARTNLRRFLKSNDINVGDLAIQRPGEPKRPIKTLIDLQSPADFAFLVHVRGKLISEEPLIAEDTLGKRSNMPLGKAFMLADLRPFPGQGFITSPMGTKFSNRAMPKWYAVREIRSD